jgi:phosphonopyruvate decarboxylase
MLDTDNFVKSLIKQGYTHLCVVPCSFAKNMINSAINNSDLIEYLPCASEAVACSTAAGLKMAGEAPIVIVQSSGLTNMASCITSLLVPYGVYFPIITSWRTYKDGDSEIQHQHLATKLPNLIKAYGYDYEILDQDDIGVAIAQVDKANSTNQICVLKKDTFSKVELEPKHQLDLSMHIPRSRYLQILNNSFQNDDILFIGTTGNAAREMYSFMPDTNNFYMAGNMGGALSVGLGVAKSGKKVIVCGGDAEFVMHMGGLTTAGRYASEIDLTYILFDNESNKSTGGQNTYQDHIDYIGIVRSSNFNILAEKINTLDGFSKALVSSQDSIGAKFIYIKCAYDKETPRPPIEAVARNII